MPDTRYQNWIVSITEPGGMISELGTGAHQLLLAECSQTKASKVSITSPGSSSHSHGPFQWPQQELSLIPKLALQKISNRCRYWRRLSETRKTKVTKVEGRNFPGDPVAKTLCFQYRVSRFDPWSVRHMQPNKHIKTIVIFVVQSLSSVPF